MTRPSAGSAPGPDQAGAARGPGRAIGASDPRFAWQPFAIYTVLGLGIPTLAVATLPSRSESGTATLANLHRRDTAPPARFENSLVLAAITSVVPGILGLILAYAIETSKKRRSCGGSSRRPRGCSRTSAASRSPSCSSRRSGRRGSDHERVTSSGSTSTTTASTSTRSAASARLPLLPDPADDARDRAGGRRAPPQWREAAANLGAARCSSGARRRPGPAAVGPGR